MLPLVKARYLARATATPISFGDSSKGNTQIAIEFQVEEHAEFTGETITYIGTFADGSTEFVIEALLNAGWQGEDPSELDSVPGNQALPEQVSLACDVDTYNGKQQLKVGFVNKPRGVFKFQQATEPGNLRALGARLRSTVQSIRAQGGRTRQAGSGGSGRSNSGRSGNSGGGSHPNAPGSDWGAPRAAGGPDDDIPFATADIAHEPSPIASILRRTV